MKTYWIDSPKIRRGQPDYNLERFKKQKKYRFLKIIFFLEREAYLRKKSLPKIPNIFGNNFLENIDHK